MSKIFIQNPTGENVAVRITGGEGSSLNNHGPEGAVVTENGYLAMCLSPEVILPEPLVNTTQAVNLEGKFVVKIDGEFVPYLFSAEDLKTYFDANNTNGTNVQFEVVNNLRPISCEGAFSEAGTIIFSSNNQSYSLEVNGQVVNDNIQTLEELSTLLYSQYKILMGFVPATDNDGNQIDGWEVYFYNTDLNNAITCRLTSNAGTFSEYEWSYLGAITFSTDGSELDLCFTSCEIPVEIDQSSITSTVLLKSPNLRDSTFGVLYINCGTVPMIREPVPGESKLTVYGETPYFSDKMTIESTQEIDGSYTWRFSNRTSETLYVSIWQSGSGFDMQAGVNNTNSSVYVTEPGIQFVLGPAD